MVTDNEYVRNQIKLELQNILAEELPAFHTYAESALTVLEDDLVTADAIQAILGILAGRASRLSQTAEDMMCDSCQYIRDDEEEDPEEEDPEDTGKYAWIKDIYQRAFKDACMEYFDSASEAECFFDPIISERAIHWVNAWPGNEDPYAAGNKRERMLIERAAEKDAEKLAEQLEENAADMEED